MIPIPVSSLAVISVDIIKMKSIEWYPCKIKFATNASSPIHWPYSRSSMMLIRHVGC